MTKISIENTQISAGNVNTVSILLLFAPHKDPIICKRYFNAFEKLDNRTQPADPSNNFDENLQNAIPHIIEFAVF